MIVIAERDVGQLELAATLHESVRGLQENKGIYSLTQIFFLYSSSFKELEQSDVMKTKEVEKFRLTFLRKDKTTISKHFKIVEALYNDAVALGGVPLKNPLVGLDVDLRIAAVISRVSKTS